MAVTLNDINAANFIFKYGGKFTALAVQSLRHYEKNNSRMIE